jgi:hypothetical protein
VEEKMKGFLAVVGPVAGNFIAWTVITLLPVHQFIILLLAIASGILMICAIIYFTTAVDKGEAAQGKS